MPGETKQRCRSAMHFDLAIAPPPSHARSRRREPSAGPIHPPAHHVLDALRSRLRLSAAYVIEWKGPSPLAQLVLAPLLFLGFAQAAVTIGELEKASAPAAEEKARKEHGVAATSDRQVSGRSHAGKAEEGQGRRRQGQVFAKAAYVFAGLFAILYVVGRTLEDRLVKSL